MAKHDVEFEVSAGERSQVTSDWKEACRWAIQFSAHRGGEMAVIDVIVHSRAGAGMWAGSHGRELYDEDPDASVFERFEVRARSVGRIA